MTDTLDGDVVERVATAISHLDIATFGEIHTVLIELDGRRGGCLVRVSSTQAEDLVLYVT